MAPAISEHKDFKYGLEEFKNAYKMGLGHVSLALGRRLCYKILSHNWTQVTALLKQCSQMNEQ